MWKDDFQFLTLLSTKLRNTLVPNSLDKPMLLISMEPHIYDFEESVQCSTKLIQLNYSYLKILDLKINSLFGHAFLCTHAFSLPFFFIAKSPIFAVSFIEKPPELTKDPKWPTGINIFTRNNLMISIVLIWYLPIVNLLSFLPVLMHSR